MNLKIMQKKIEFKESPINFNFDLWRSPKHYFYLNYKSFIMGLTDYFDLLSFLNYQEFTVFIIYDYINTKMYKHLLNVPCLLYFLCF